MNFEGDAWDLGRSINGSPVIEPSERVVECQGLKYRCVANSGFMRQFLWVVSGGRSLTMKVTGGIRSSVRTEPHSGRPFDKPDGFCHAPAAA